jgi:Fur family transcriptional regulator, ferric uptake regulator
LTTGPIMRKSPDEIPQTEPIRGRLRAAGLRSTAARLAVMRELLVARNPLTHAQVAVRLARRGFDRATIYRNLIELSDAGLLLRVELGDHVWRFEARRNDADRPSEHPHFVCVDCGEVSCLSSVNVRITPAPGGAGTVIGQVTEVLLKGRCGRCA